tara:strand:- start:58 stop:585 length:528 start_codon:yes stop_codon:yes gene_type:complete
MKNILIVSSTLKNNFKLANSLNDYINDISKSLSYDLKTNVISLENFDLPVYTDDNFDKYIEKYRQNIEKLTQNFTKCDGIIICAPEYNGSTPPIVNNAIAWISTTTDYWRDAFNNKAALVCTNSGGVGAKYITIMKLQLEHLGCVVMPRAISSNKNNPLNPESVKKILKQFIKHI